MNLSHLIDPVNKDFVILVEVALTDILAGGIPVIHTLYYSGDGGSIILTVANNEDVSIELVFSRYKFGPEDERLFAYLYVTTLDDVSMDIRFSVIDAENQKILNTILRGLISKYKL